MNIRLIHPKPAVATALTLCCAFVLAGCQSGSEASANRATTASTTPVAAALPLTIETATPPGAPATVIHLSGRNVVLNLGAATLEAGTLYAALRVTPGVQTVPSGTPCCAIEVDRVAAQHAYGHIVNADFRQAGKFVPGSIELSSPIPLQSTVDVTAKTVAAN